MNTALSSVSLTDVRCFADEQHANLSKITLLVGENSVGKTTFLGCLNALGQLASLNELEDKVNYFDEAPFSMGSFDTLARSGADSFRVATGWEGGPFSQFAIEFAKGDTLRLKENELKLKLSDSPSEMDSTLTIVREISENDRECWCFDGPSFQFRLNQSEASYTQFTTWLARSIRYGLLPFAGTKAGFEMRTGDTANQNLAAFIKFSNFFKHRFRPPKTPHRIISIDPRSLKLKRLYDFNPFEESNDTLNKINDVGRRLGLFNQVEVRQDEHGKFQVLIDVSGSLRNLNDVGHGVASLLPFIKTLVKASSGTLFLLQQPEVHIHPSAQAKLVEMMADSKHAFVIETHSDHIIDWFRILVMEKKLAHSDVAIIYFEPLPGDASATRLHHISLDKCANLNGQPPSYRRFFSNETNKLLGLPT